MTTGLEGVKGDSDSNYSCIVFSTDKRASLFNRDLRVRLKESTSLYSKFEFSNLPENQQNVC